METKKHNPSVTLFPSLYLFYALAAIHCVSHVDWTLLVLVDYVTQQWAPWLIGINFNSNVVRERERKKAKSKILTIKLDGEFAHFRISLY